METSYYREIEDGRVQCLLCPHECIIAQGKEGICKVRKNIGGKLHLDVYGILSATNFDPIEKKPLYHFHPGKEIYSLGSLGCNFKCGCCQNYHIAQSGKKDFPHLTKMDIPDIMKNVRSDPYNIGVAYTYNEPMVWYEYMSDIAREVSLLQYKNVVVSNGFINTEPLLKLTEYIDAFNIDLKGFDSTMYKSFAGGKLKTVLNNLQLIKERGCHLEITFLAIPGINDDTSQFQKMVEWIKQNLGADVPFHISRYFPNYKLSARATSVELLQILAETANDSMHYVYVGNMPGNDFQNTYCPNCKKLVIQRNGYTINRKNLSLEGTCVSCGYDIAIT